ncbi:hypothetical protein AMECASPLE_038681 [Ameca splendens]|uniref:Uncharacterized protein n=1 Tax=Ameca splendens TaxID=208324 RepID=A0ABV0YWL5_9TELE
MLLTSPLEKSASQHRLLEEKCDFSVFDLLIAGKSQLRKRCLIPIPSLLMGASLNKIPRALLAFELMAMHKVCCECNLFIEHSCLTSLYGLELQTSGHRYGPTGRRKNTWNGFRAALSGISISLLKVCFEFRCVTLPMSTCFSQLEKRID